MTLYMIGKLTPNSPHFTRGLVKYVPGRGYFRAVFSQNGDKFATSPTPPIVERLSYPNMPRKESEAVPEGIGPVPRQEFGPDQPTLVDLYRLLKEGFERERKENKSLPDKMDVLSCKMGEISEDWRSMDQRLTRLEHDARQPRLVMEADRPANTKTERTEGAATTVQAMHGDSFIAQRVQDGPKISTCFGVMPEPPALPCRDGVVVQNGAAVPKSRLPSLEMRSPTAAGGLPSTGEASIATRITFNQPPIRLYSTEESNSKKTSTPYVSYDSIFFRKNNLAAVPSCRRAIEAKTGKNRMFDPGGS